MRIASITRIAPIQPTPRLKPRCAPCHGTGYITQPNASKVRCHACEGTGIHPLSQP